MNQITGVAMVVAGMALGVQSALAIEEAAYDVVERDGALEIRDYEPCILAEIQVDASMEDAGNRAFRRLFAFISGDNSSRAKIAMTSPVGQASSETIAMTAPVGQERVGSRWVVSFMMPGTATMDTLPTPTDPGITLREVPGRRTAAIRYAGRWTQQGFDRHRLELESWMSARGLQAAGNAVWARYNSPFSLWFMRRNEVLIPVAGDSRYNP